ncbi:MAG TPA: LytTR family DNA-binding domain-containing protein [Gemmatimonadaceae bacterium]|nr:LytTR family DNA-binding domain-containing protein [Gemmatimonadaceae bacterium]
MKVSALIADDEPAARTGLRDMLTEVNWVTCVGEVANGPAAVEAINALRPELVFLDIQMPGLLGTEVLRRVQHQPFVVFTTAYGQHAVTAFEIGALDYLLKPFGPERLATALERVRAAFGEPNAIPALDRLSEALSSGPMSRLFVRSGRSIIPVAVDGVAWFEALGDYVAAHVGRSRHMLHLSLNRLEARLDPKRFSRIHRTHIVNLEHVKAFRRDGKGHLNAELADGTRLAVSRNRARAIRSLGA